MAARTTRTTRAARKATSAAGRIANLALATARQARAAVLHAKENVAARADGARSRASEAVSLLEKVFEERVQGAISRLGVPTAHDVRALSQQVARLQQSVDRLRRSRARA